MFDVVNKSDDVLDAADNNNRDDTNKKFIDNWEDMFDAVEDDRDDSDTNKTTLLDGFVFFSTLQPWLTLLFSVAVIFGGVDRSLNLGCLVFIQKESKLPFLNDWEVLVGGVLQTFVLDGCGIEPINVVCCQFWFLFHHGFDTMGLLLGLTLVFQAV